MLSSEYTSTVLLRAREEQLQRDVERERVARERKAELLAARREPAQPAKTGIITRAFATLVARPRQEAEPECR